MITPYPLRFYLHFNRLAQYSKRIFCKGVNGNVKGYGETTKQIRISKGYTQKYVAAHLLTQGAYSKFENNNTEINLGTMHGILQRLGIPFEEFIYIHNGYQYSQRNEIIIQFYRIHTHDEALLKGLRKKCQHYLKENKDDLQIIHIATILDGLIILAKTNDLEQAKTIVEPVWYDLSKHNQLFVTDLYMLNSILFLFPLPTVLQMKQFILRHITMYENFGDVSRLHIHLLMNITYLLMRNKNYAIARSEILNTIILCKKENDFVLLGICYIRKGICLNRLGLVGDKWICKGKNLLKVLEQFTLLDKIENEMKRL